MSLTNPPDGGRSRLNRLLGYLKDDPDNLRLVADAARAALDEDEPAETERLLLHYASIEPLPPGLVNIHGLAVLKRGQPAEAASIFTDALAEAPNDTVLKFNLALALSAQEDYAAADAVLDEWVTASSPKAALLKVRMLHHLGRLEDALACGLGFAELFPGNAPLMGALSEVALDARELDLARDFAVKAGGQAEGLSTAGLILLSEDKTMASIEVFDRALAAEPGNARAQLGKGLALMARQDLRAAAPLIEHGAQTFRTHIGSWVAAGWAYLLAGNLRASRANFDRALALDDNFGETQGGLAVLDILDGDLASAQRRTEVALRLDRNCLSGALAKSLLLEAQGDKAAAERVREIAMNRPLGPNQRTITQSLQDLGLRPLVGPRPTPPKRRPPGDR